MIKHNSIQHDMLLNRYRLHSKPSPGLVNLEASLTKFSEFIHKKSV